MGKQVRAGLGVGRARTRRQQATDQSSLCLEVKAASSASV